ncbi:translation initiation factor SUI1 [Paracoccidioides lutzii Pb01]|uniref:Translation initiation factor SUI1 n=1 Tax=Paracoccidioides lutzii (strain ATCC MYA-826 / Pb01) TaxID=502779 RepID=A0A0A2V4C5_PARBA|nr:translation initiation factor SUI1 [Paracoccidioides lutzii Pb01]KGQ01172.1 translation initiation factor SUI1 [Paracoccidioides lutzii Pb01]
MAPSLVSPHAELSCCVVFSVSTNLVEPASGHPWKYGETNQGLADPCHSDVTRTRLLHPVVPGSDLLSPELATSCLNGSSILRVPVSFFLPQQQTSSVSPNALPTLSQLSLALLLTTHISAACLCTTTTTTTTTRHSPIPLDLTSNNPFPFFKSVVTKNGFMSIENLKTFDPFAEADEDTGDTKQSQNYIHIRIQQRNGRKTLTTVQGLPKKFDQKKILKVIKKKFACNGTIVNDSEMGEVIQLQGDQRKDVQEFLVDKKEGLELDAKTIKVHGF